jgi:hypothetical protein
MPPLGFEPTILATQGPPIHALDRAATGIGKQHNNIKGYSIISVLHSSLAS